MSGDISPYLARITSEHRNQPQYVAFMSVILQGLCDAKAVAQSLPGLFDLDVAVGQQLDFCGQWLGQSRTLREAIGNAYFSWDTAGQGWDQGSWGTGGGGSTIVVLPDQQYRTLLQFTAAANEWDGTIPGSYAVWDPVFAPLGFHLEITDHQDMTIEYTLVGTTPDNLTLGLYQNGYFDLRPGGVAIIAHN